MSTNPAGLDSVANFMIELWRHDKDSNENIPRAQCDLIRLFWEQNLCQGHSISIEKSPGHQLYYKN